MRIRALLLFQLLFSFLSSSPELTEIPRAWGEARASSQDARAPSRPWFAERPSASGFFSLLPSFPLPVAAGNAPSQPAWSRRFPCSRRRLPVNHGAGFPAGKQSPAVQEHLHGCFQSPVGVFLQSFWCLRALAASAVPLCFSPSLGINRRLGKILISFFP